MPLQTCMLGELHETHPRVGRMKALARLFVRWPGLDGHIEERVRSGRKCTDAQLASKVVPLLLWPWATEL